MGLDLLKLGAEFARADQASKKERIQDAGQDINEKHALYLERASNDFNYAKDKYNTAYTRWDSTNRNLRALGSDASKDDIARALLKSEIGAVEFAKLDEDERGALIKDYYGNIEAYDNANQLVDLNDEGAIKYRVSESYNPAPKLPSMSDYYDASKFDKYEEDIKNNVKGEWTDFINKLRGKEVTSADNIIAQLQADIDEGYKSTKEEARQLGLIDNKPYEFNVRDTKASLIESFDISLDSDITDMPQYKDFVKSFSGANVAATNDVKLYDRIAKQVLNEELVKGMFTIQDNTAKIEGAGTYTVETIQQLIKDAYVRETNTVKAIQANQDGTRQNPIAEAQQYIRDSFNSSNVQKQVVQELRIRLINVDDFRGKLVAGSDTKPYFIDPARVPTQLIGLAAEKVGGIENFKKELSKRITKVYGKDEGFLESADFTQQKTAMDSEVELYIAELLSEEAPAETATTDNASSVVSLSDNQQDIVVVQNITSPDGDIIPSGKYSVSDLKGLQEQGVVLPDSILNLINPGVSEDVQETEAKEIKPIETQVQELFTNADSIDSIISSIPKQKIGQGRAAKDNPDYSEWMENNKEVFNNLVDSILNIQPDKGKRNNINPEWNAWNKKYKDILKIGKQ
jgi:hypothetical protein